MHVGIIFHSFWMEFNASGMDSLCILNRFQCSAPGTYNLMEYPTLRTNVKPMGDSCSNTDRTRGGQHGCPGCAQGLTGALSGGQMTAQAE